MLSTKELLYLEDVAKLLESSDKNCHQILQTSSDNQGKSIMQTICNDHQQWISTVSSLVNSNGMMQ